MSHYVTVSFYITHNSELRDNLVDDLDICINTYMYTDSNAGGPETLPRGPPALLIIHKFTSIDNMSTISK